MDTHDKSYNLKYKECAGKNCDKKGINRLKILYIKKVGYFCDSCASQLLELDLVAKEGESLL